MKKLLIVALVIIILALLGIYFLIPGKIVISKAIPVQSNMEGSYRLLQSESNWKYWWPGTKEDTSGPTFSFNGYTYSLQQKGLNLLVINIERNKETLPSEFIFIPLSADSMFIEWRAEKQTGSNPISRIREFFAVRGLQADMQKILSSLKPFLENQKNIYGIVVDQTKVKDSTLISSRIETDDYPSVQDIYTVIQKLRNYIQQEGAKETDSPMLHVDTIGGKYSSQVAIPTNSALNGNGSDIVLKRMVLGNILVTEVKGGPHAINYASNQLQQYVDDHKRAMPAISFESLVTDRLAQPDTTQWITKIYYPVL